MNRNWSVVFLIWFAFVIIAILLFLNFKFDWGQNESVSTALNLITVVTAVLGVSGVVLQLSREKSLKEVEFLIDFNKSFVEIEDLMEVHNICSERAGLPVDSHYKDVPLNYTGVYKYLDCIEPLYFLLKTKLVNIDKIYDLVSYRFFIVVNNSEVQKEIISIHQSSYFNIISMYKTLENYRKKKNLPEPFPHFVDNDLITYLDKHQIAKLSN